MSTVQAFHDDTYYLWSRPDWWRYRDEEPSSPPRPLEAPSGDAITPCLTGQLLRGSDRPSQAEAPRGPVTAVSALPSMDQAVQQLLTITQAAERLQVGRCTMQALVLDGSVRSMKIGRLRRIPPEALAEYISRASES